MASNDLHEHQAVDRTHYSDAIIESRARNKIIVAGPGTGKSFTFKKVLETKSGKNLALTFIKNLANDLREELGELAESHTFHAYCRKLLHRTPVDGIDTDFRYFPKLPLLITSDAQLLNKNYTEKDIENSFQLLSEDDKVIFFIEQSNYYNAVSHNDAVYRVLKYFQSARGDLPVFSQVVVDEYQDFNPLEVAFINELSKTSPILIAGDDDQAIYDFKNASPEHIRQKFNEKDFVKFELPYCSRCTEVIIKAVHNIISKALFIGKLQDRIQKRYICFMPKKERESQENPKIIHACCSVHRPKAPFIAKFIEMEINKIPQFELEHARENGYPCVLIIGPSHYNDQIYKYLKLHFTGIDFKEKKDTAIDIFDGYKILIANKKSNLGWRIILEYADSEYLQATIKTAYENKQALNDVISNKFKHLHLEVVSILEKIRDGSPISKDEQVKVTEFCGKSIEDIQRVFGVDIEDIENGNKTDEENATNAIKITTINGSKGLSADYVFIVGMNKTSNSHRGFPKNSSDPTDNEICQLIVGMTRTRKRCYLVSNRSFGKVYNIDSSVFIKWIDPSLIESITVNAEYFKNHE
ncbi:MAG: ATP-dependent helicase [Candidatus Gracilibacteria bacterium]|nr:ATP-dependent helicase [Candidatus Gracilibacteria bacterium]